MYEYIQYMHTKLLTNFTNFIEGMLCCLGDCSASSNTEQSELDERVIKHGRCR